MKNLHDLFESMTTKEFAQLLAIQEKKNINPVNQKKILDYVSIVYCAEKKVKEAEVTQDEMILLIDDFFASLSLYANVVLGKMKVVSGRIKLTDGNSCRFSLTQQGIQFAQQLIKSL